jgi:hypothetical protein
VPRDSREDIEVEIVRLHRLDLGGLRQAWRAIFGRSAPAHSPKIILLRTLSYHLQAEAFGDLSRSTVQALSAISRGPVGSDVPPASVPGGLRPGTVLIREYEGNRHHVMVVPDGFSWNGKIFPSLSKVAYAITGTKWNGPRFFGLREKRP